MADNKPELIVQVDVDKANVSVRSVNAGLSSIERIRPAIPSYLS